MLGRNFITSKFCIRISQKKHKVKQQALFLWVLCMQEVKNIQES